MYFLLREDAQGKLLALKDKADKELAQYQTELKVQSYNKDMMTVGIIGINSSH